MIKAVLIDIDDTLLDFHLCMRFSALEASNFAGICLPDGFESTFHRINNSLWKRIEEGSLATDGLFKIRWNLILGELGISGVDGVEFEKLFLSNMESAAEPVEGAESLLEYLNKKYKIFVASNAPQNQQELRMKKAGFDRFLNGIFTSELLGVAKPNVEFFYKCAELSGFEPKDMVMIGDSLSADMKGAKSAGMTTVFFDRKKSAADKSSADFVVSALHEITDIL